MLASLSRTTLASALVLVACGDSGGEGSATDTTAGTGTTTGTTNTTPGTTPGTTTDDPPTTSATGGEAVRPNWHADIAPLVAESCRSCHTVGGIAPFAMDTYAEASPWAPLMADDVDKGIMPPWHAQETDLCQPPLGFRHDPRLTPEQKTMFRDWAELGAPEGDPALAAPIPTPPSLDLPNPTKTVTMGSAVSVDKVSSTLDFFHCLSLDPGNAGTVYVDGLQVVPGNRAIVHHVLIYVDPTAASASWPGGVQKDCGGGAGVAAPTQLVGGWVPGGLPMQPPPGVGVELPAGARLVLNVHYHATGGGPETDDGTGLALRWTDTKPQWVSLFELIGEPGTGTPITGGLMVPAGAKNHVEDYEWTVSSGGQPFPDSIDARVWSIAHHMHKVGVDARVWVEDRDTGVATCLLHTPRWDYNWQRFYEYDAPIESSVRLKSGDKIRVRCTYDNSLDNPGVVEALAEVGLTDPIDVHVGEKTLDEMCLAGFGVAVKGI
jgi:hypothetical protein